VTIDESDPANSWRMIVETGAAVVISAQTAAASLALGYFRTLGSLELGQAPSIAAQRPKNIGFTEDGRAIVDVLGAPRARFFRKLDEGKRFTDLLPEAIEAIGRAAQFEVMDAGQRELAHQVTASDQAVGWRARSRGTCGACLALDDGAHTTRRPPFHPHCNCTIEVDFGTDGDLGRATGRQRFDALTIDQQDAALGFEKAELLRRNLIDWPDLVAVQTFKEWTPVISEAPLEQLLTIAGITSEQLVST
jgi:hypothetical protein